MRWKRLPPPKTGDIKIFRHFLWFPKTLDGKDGEETRWLEFANVLYKYTYFSDWIECSWAADNDTLPKSKGGRGKPTIPAPLPPSKK